MRIGKETKVTEEATPIRIPHTPTRAPARGPVKEPVPVKRAQLLKVLAENSESTEVFKIPEPDACPVCGMPLRVATTDEGLVVYCSKHGPPWWEK